MAFYEELWFWILAVGLLLFVLGVIFYDYDRNASTNQTPYWVWALLVLSIVLIIISIIIYAITFPSKIEKCCGSWRYSKNAEDETSKNNYENGLSL